MQTAVLKLHHYEDKRLCVSQTLKLTWLTVCVKTAGVLVFSAERWIIGIFVEGSGKGSKTLGLTILQGEYIAR